MLGGDARKTKTVVLRAISSQLMGVGCQRLRVWCTMGRCPIKTAKHLDVVNLRRSVAKLFAGGWQLAVTNQRYQSSSQCGDFSIGNMLSQVSQRAVRTKLASHIVHQARSHQRTSSTSSTRSTSGTEMPVIRLYVVNAFTSNPFGDTRGNPAAVCLIEGGLSMPDQTMQQISAQMNLAEVC